MGGFNPELRAACTFLVYESLPRVLLRLNLVEGVLKDVQLRTGEYKCIISRKKNKNRLCSMTCGIDKIPLKSFKKRFKKDENKDILTNNFFVMPSIQRKRSHPKKKSDH